MIQSPRLKRSPAFKFWTIGIMACACIAFVLGFDLQSLLQNILFRVGNLGVRGEIGLLPTVIVTLTTLFIRKTVEQNPFSYGPCFRQTWRSRMGCDSEMFAFGRGT